MERKFIEDTIEYLEEQGLTVYVKHANRELGKRGNPSDLIIQDVTESGSVLEIYGVPQGLDLELLTSLKMLLEGRTEVTDNVDEQLLLSRLISNMENRESDLKGTVRSMLKELSDAADASASAFFLFEETKPEVLSCLCAKGGAEWKIEGKEIPVEGSLAGLAYTTGQPILIADVSSHPRHYRGFEFYYKTKNVLAIPIKGKYKTLGVVEFVNKPGGFSIEDLLLLERSAAVAGVILEGIVVRRQFEMLLEDALSALVEALNRRTKGAGMHSHRVRTISMKLGRCLGLGEEELEALHLAALIFDVGKIGVSDTILNKEPPLTKEEYEEVKKHVFYGVEIVSQVEEIPQAVIDVVLYHHERWNGEGYPDGLSGSEIPILARIVGAADVFCALTEPRPHRKPMEKEEVMEYMKRESGKLFDPNVIRCLEEVEDG